MTLLARLGILEIAFSAVIVPIFLFEPFQKIFPVWLKDRKQLLQAHLDYFFMGILLLLAGTVLQPLPRWIVWPLVVGSLGNPTVFLVNSFTPSLPKKPLYRALILLTCGATAFAWAALGLRAFLNLG
jgi:hypothetical protein